MVRAKFRLQEVTQQAGTAARQLRFTAVTLEAGEVEENARYHKYTPSGELKMTVDNPAAVEQFKCGACYYLDFTPCPDATAS